MTDDPAAERKRLATIAASQAAWATAALLEYATCGFEGDTLDATSGGEEVNQFLDAARITAEIIMAEREAAGEPADEDLNQVHGAIVRFLGGVRVGSDPAAEAAYAKGLEDAAQIADGYGRFEPDTDHGIGYQRAAQNTAAAIRALSPLPPGSRVVVVPREGSPEFDALVDKIACGIYCDPRLGGPTNIDAWNMSPAKEEFRRDARAALRALTGGDDRAD